jgi:hypothetical protein
MQHNQSAQSIKSVGLKKPPQTLGQTLNKLIPGAHSQSP